MIQFNLLPDIKLQYIKAQQLRRLMTTIAALVTLASLALLILMAGLHSVQSGRLNKLSTNITLDSKKLQAEPQLDKVLTIQNQLNSLTALHDGKPGVSRAFQYLEQITPAQVKISNISFDFNADTVIITGTSDALSSVNTYIDTLKFTTYTTQDSTEATKAFSNVVLTSFGVSNDQTDPTQKVNYTINASYDPVIFDLTKTVKLLVPDQITTRSEVEKPTDLFTATPSTTTEKTGATR